MRVRECAAAITAMLWLAGTAAAQPAITVLQNFDGIPADGVAPPNTIGKAGATQFVQWVNNKYAIYDKNTGQQVQPPQPGNSLWKKLGGPCATMNNGEPMVEYDKAAGPGGRWVLAQLALSDPAYYCFAVSQTTDARGSFYLYAFPFPAGMKPNTPRLAVWTDAYYASFNIQQVGKPAAPMVVAYDRSHMLLGQTALGPVSRQPAARTNFLPADFDGTRQPSGEPDFYVEGGASTYLSLWQFRVDFANPNNSSFTHTATLPFSVFSVGCSRNPPVWGNPVIPQPNTSALLLAHPEQLMYRLAWRNVNGTEHLVANETVILSSSPVVAGVVWFDIVNPATNPALAQYAPVSDPAISYWIGSLAQDKDGDIALGFNASSPSLYPSVEIAGRLASDPPNTMSQPEFLVEGGGAQANTSKWGSHADMSLDPSDDCVFWFTAEYVKTTQQGFDWSTRIGSFRFNACQ